MIQSLHIQTGQPDGVLLLLKGTSDVVKSGTIEKGSPPLLSHAENNASHSDKSFLAVLESVAENAMDYALEEGSPTLVTKQTGIQDTMSFADQHLFDSKSDIDTVLMGVLEESRFSFEPDLKNNSVSENKGDEQFFALKNPYADSLSTEVDKMLSDMQSETQSGDMFFADVDKNALLKVFETDENTSQLERTGIEKKSEKTNKKNFDSAALAGFIGMQNSNADSTSFTASSINLAGDMQRGFQSDTDFLSRMHISVRDERTKGISDSTAALDEGTSLQYSVRYTTSNTAEVSLDIAGKTALAMQGQGGVFGIEESVSSSSRFESLLSSELRANAAELVKTGAIILRDNNSGSIQLTVRPEELGNVKINLELADKHIVGKIIVSSEEAYNAFKQNMQGIKDAFIAGGFESAGFELSLAGSGAGHNGEAQDKEKQAEHNMRSPFYASSIPAAEDSNASEMVYSRQGLNVLA